MSTISVTSINDGDAVTAASINNQVNTIVNDYNGNITAANLAANAVTDAKITANNLLSTKFSIPYKFYVYRNAAWTSVNAAPGVVLHDTKIFDTGTNIDIVTNKGRFTAPVAGFYFFSAAGMANMLSGSIYFSSLFKNGSEILRGDQSTTAGTVNASSIVSGVLQLSANDYIEHTFQGVGGAGVTGQVATWFQGFLLSSI